MEGAYTRRFKCERCPLPDQWRVLQQQRLDTQQGYHGDTIITQNAREKTLHNMYRDTTNQNRTASQRCTLRK